MFEFSDVDAPTVVIELLEPPMMIDALGSDWQEGAPFYMLDSETILSRTRACSEFGRIEPIPMTAFTIRHDGIR